MKLAASTIGLPSSRQPYPQMPVTIKNSASSHMWPPQFKTKKCCANSYNQQGHAGQGGRTNDMVVAIMGTELVNSLTGNGTYMRQCLTSEPLQMVIRDIPSHYRPFLDDQIGFFCCYRPFSNDLIGYFCSCVLSYLISSDKALCWTPMSDEKN